MLQLKVMDTADLAAVLALQAQCYGPEFHESAQAFQAKLDASRGLHCSFLAREGGQDLGYVVSLPVDDASLPALDAAECPRPRQPRMMYLHDLAVAPAGRERRLGNKLVQQVVQRAQDMGLACISLVAVQGSQAWWQRQGFTEVAAPAAPLAQKLASFGPGASFMQRELVPA